MAIKEVEVPGRLAGKIAGVDVKGVGAQCPYCSKVYDEFDYEKGEKLAYPVECKRCGSPMDRGKKAQEFNDDMAEMNQQEWPTKKQGMTVQEALAVLIEAGYLPPRKDLEK